MPSPPSPTPDDAVPSGEQPDGVRPAGSAPAGLLDVPAPPAPLAEPGADALGGTGGKRTLTAIALAALAVVLAVGIGLFFALPGDDAAPAAAAATSPTTAAVPVVPVPPTGVDVELDPDGVAPEDLGEDPDGTLQPLADACYEDAVWNSCDELWLAAPDASPYEVYGGTCGQRLPLESGTCAGRLGEGNENAPVYGVQIDDLPVAPPPVGAPPEYQPYVDACQQGRMLSCDVLRAVPDLPGLEPVRTYGQNCGGRRLVTPEFYCIQMLPGNL